MSICYPVGPVCVFRTFHTYIFIYFPPNDWSLAKVNATLYLSPSSQLPRQKAPDATVSAIFHSLCPRDLLFVAADTASATAATFCISDAPDNAIVEAVIEPLRSSGAFQSQDRLPRIFRLGFDLYVLITNF